MSKTKKIVLFIFASSLVIAAGAYLLICVLWNGTFRFTPPKEIAAYDSPDGEYSLIIEQMGDPQWPFGPTDIRLTLKHNGKTLGRASTQLFNDGVSAGEYNVVSVAWNDDAVTVTFRASEMKDKDVSLPYHPS